MTGAITYRQEMRRCGSATCDRCREGPGHGPYWYGYYRDESGRLRSRYFGKARPDTDSGEPERQRPRPSALTPEQRPTPLRIHLLGGLVVERGGAPVSEREWSRGSARRLFALLALHPDGLSRDEVREALWPERDAETTAGVLKVGLSVLRRILEPGTGAATGPPGPPAP